LEYACIRDMFAYEYLIHSVKDIHVKLMLSLSNY